MDLRKKLLEYREVLLSERIRLLLHQSLSTVGLGEDTFSYIEEELRVAEVKPVRAYIRWMQEHNMTFGRRNYDRMVDIFVEHTIAMENMGGYVESD